MLHPARCAAELRVACCSWVCAAFGVLDDNVAEGDLDAGKETGTDKDTRRQTLKQHFEALAGKVIAWETCAETEVCRASALARHQVLANGTSIVVLEDGTIVRARADRYDTG